MKSNSCDRLILFGVTLRFDFERLTFGGDFDLTFDVSNVKRLVRITLGGNVKSSRFLAFREIPALGRLLFFRDIRFLVAFWLLRRFDFRRNQLEN